jgi:hypothetical protein
LIDAVISEYDVDRGLATKIADWLANNKDHPEVDGFMYDHYESDMPYGTRKARDGDPSNWIADHVSSVFKQELRAL